MGLLQHQLTLCVEATVIVSRTVLVLRRFFLLELGHLAQLEPSVAHGLFSVSKPSPVSHGIVNESAHGSLLLMGGRLMFPHHVHFFCHLLWKIHGGTLAVVADFLDVLGAVWRPCIIFDVVPIHFGSKRSVQHLAPSAHVPVWRAFVPSVVDVRSPLYARRKRPCGGGHTVALFFPLALATPAAPPTSLFVTTRTV